MASSTHESVVGYLIIIVGLMLALISALIPFYTSGYELQIKVLLAGLLPYLTYGIAVVLLRRMITIVVGTILLAIHAWLVIQERFIDGGNYNDGMIYVVPIVLTLVLTPLVVMALRQPWLE